MNLSTFDFVELVVGGRNTFAGEIPSPGLGRVGL